MAAAPGRVTEAQRATVPARGNEDGDRRERRIAAGRSPAWIIHTPKLEARRQGGLLLRPRARAGNAAARRPASMSTRPIAGNAAARRPASTSTRPGWKRGGKAACFYVHAPGLETRRQGLLWSHWGCVAKGSLRRCLSERRRSGGSSGPDRQRGLFTRPSWKAACGGKAACFYVHAPKLETRRQGGLLLRPRAQAGNAAARRPASTSTRPGWKRGGKAACCGRTGDA